ncbi:hypothetical protein [Halobiforma nitratireducens]|uniref:Uncharacterized protein n=1 Tax=Halobiforma nitratireducens JCM 10879 TaxID=1227454 RepID=M0M161_9EURY|nr:hypothetical protein [Halobiforma nitratireducens]EMA39158.1 hypothetical protein C446_08816 [Halobiforma nitratireducens JCM 10879]
MGMGGAVGGVARDDLPQIVADLVLDRGDDLEIWIRPERAGYGYTVEWTTVEFDQDEQAWRPSRVHGDSAGQDTDRASVCQTLSSLMDNVRGKMPTFDVDREQINVFAVGDRYLFKQYFDEDAVFDALRPYYNEDDYRFEVPEDAFADVQEILEDHFYEPVVIQDLEPFCVVHPKYTEHPSVLFKASVLQRSHGDRHVFLLKDQLSVEQAVNNGATALAETDIDDVFP